jgi:YfiR/HmsC-like
VLFVGATAHAKIREISQFLHTHPLLVVAEERDFDPKDVIILLQLQGDRYVFKINQTAALARSLGLSSKLLKLAVQVY